MSEEVKDVIKQINQAQEKFDIYKPVEKIKMKQEYYDKLATMIQQQVNMVEVRDVDMQPLNTIYGVKIEIDNSIKDDFEVIR